MAEGRVAMACGKCGSKGVTVAFDCRWDRALQAWVPDDPVGSEADPDGLAAWCESCRRWVDLQAAPLDDDDAALEGTVP